MTPEFVGAVVDTLLPGDAGGADGEPPLPPASATGIDLSALIESRSAVLEAIARQAGGAEAFIAAAEPARIATIQAIERAMPDAFRTLLSALLADYYESPVVLAAMGWRTDPPQPQGYAMSDLSDAAFERLARVQARGKLWRK
jgi:hypothetical protein